MRATFTLRNQNSNQKMGRCMTWKYFQGIRPRENRHFAWTSQFQFAAETSCPKAKVKVGRTVNVYLPVIIAMYWNKKIFLGFMNEDEKLNFNRRSEYWGHKISLGRGRRIVSEYSHYWEQTNKFRGEGWFCGCTNQIHGNIISLLIVAIIWQRPWEAKSTKCTC